MIVYHCNATGTELNIKNKNASAGILKLEILHLYLMQTQDGDTLRRYYSRGKYVEQNETDTIASEDQCDTWESEFDTKRMTGLVKLESEFLDVSASLVATLP